MPWLTFCVRLFSQRRCVFVAQDKLIALRSLVAILCHMFGTMAILLQDKLEIEKSEWEGVSVRKQSVRAGRFLTDANITDVFKTLGPTLPDSVLLLTPGESHMVALAAEEDAYGQLFEMNFE